MVWCGLLLIDLTNRLGISGGGGGGSGGGGGGGAMK